MGGIFGGGNDVNTSAERLLSIQLQTSSYGGVLPIVYGTQRVSANLLDYTDFTATPHTNSQDVGKGGGGGSISNTTYTYTALIIMGICETDGSATLGKIWRDKEIGDAEKFGFTFLQGGHPATPWSFMVSAHPDHAIGYSGTAYVAHPACPLTSGASLQNHSFEISGLKAIGSGNYDANMAEVLPDFCTNTIYGCGIDVKRIADLTEYGKYITASGFWVSPLVNEQKSGLDWIREWLTATNSEAIWAQGTEGMSLKVIPYADIEITGNGATFTPDVDICYDMNEDDFIVDGPDDDPITVVRKNLADTYNICPIQYRDRAIEYNDNSVDSPEQVDVDAFGERAGPPTVLNCVTTATVAGTISRALAQRSVYCRNEYTFRLGWKYSLLEPMDFVTLTDTKFGLDHRRVRIKSVECDEYGLLTVTAWEWPIGIGTPAEYDGETASGGGDDPMVDPGNTHTPIIFSAPVLYQSGPDPEIIIGASGGTHWGGCEVWVSDNDAEYAYAGRITQPARTGVLTDDLAEWESYYSVIDTDHTLSVDISESGLSLQSVPTSSCISLQSLCAIIDGDQTELLAYQTATVTGPGEYDLTTLRRGAYGTPNTSHSDGMKFLRVDGACIRVITNSNYIDQSVYIKVPAYNTHGNAMQSLADCDPYLFIPTAPSIPSPNSVSLDILPDAPTPPTNTYWPASENWNSGFDINAGVPVGYQREWAMVTWGYQVCHTSPDLFRVIIYTGDDPSDTSTWITRVIDVPGNFRGVVLNLAVPMDISSVNASVMTYFT